MTTAEIRPFPRGTRVVILGAGRSGVAAATLLHRSGCRICVWDEAAAAGDAEATLADLGLRISRPPSGSAPAPFDVAVVSPGFSVRHPWIAALRSAGVPRMAEIELAARCCRGKVLAVTGTKGKSSVTKLCVEALRLSGRTAEACGNFGYPWSQLVVAQPRCDWAVVEVSSFQLEHSWDWRPDVAILLNLMPDHLDRHGTMAAYRRIKFRLFARQCDGDTAVLPRGMRAAGLVPPGVARVRFGVGAGPGWGYDDQGSLTRCRGGEPRVTLDVRGSPFANPVWGPSAAAAAAALESAGLSDGAIETAVREFRSLPHRMEQIRKMDGVTFINDSKATSLCALEAAVRMTGGPVRLIVGGRLKEKKLEKIKESLAKNVRRVYLIGESANRLATAWSSAASCEILDTLASAVARAWRHARPGETILFSPGCASFDQFRNFEQRGERFRELVLALNPRETAGQRRIDR